MRRLMIVSGISGVGKSFLMQQLSGRAEELVLIRKLTTRRARKYEKENSGDADLKYEVKRAEIAKCDYRYNYAGNVYGFNRADIDKALSANKSPVVIVRSVPAIKTLKEDYPDCVVVFIKAAYTGNDLKKILESQGRTDIEIEERMHRHRDDLVEYTKNLQLYDYVLSNLFDEDSLITQFDEVLRLERYKGQIGYGLVFVLMSFNPELDEVFTEIEDAAKLTNDRIRVLRIDKKKGDYAITKEILENIENAELIVCDLTEEKPNVYYELGYARGKGKTVIHCVHASTTLHFDVKDFHTVFYNSGTDLRRQLALEFKEFFKDR